MHDLADLPPGLLVVLGVVALVELGLLAWALVKLFRTPPERLTLPLVAWLLIVLLVNGLGSVAFLVAGVRRPVAPPRDPGLARGESATEHAVDVLYGDRR